MNPEPARLEKQNTPNPTLLHKIITITVFVLFFIVIIKLLICFAESCRAENYYHYINQAILPVMRCYL